MQSSARLCAVLRHVRLSSAGCSRPDRALLPLLPQPATNTPMCTAPQVALRRITARNRERLQRLRGEDATAQQQGEQQQQDGSGAGAVGAMAAAVEPGRQQ